MSSLPPEILAVIFSLACTDGGSTGCSLSQVSRYFRSVARPVRFQSIALVSDSPLQLVKFITCFSAECERAGSVARPRVLRLCLASAQRAMRSIGRRTPTRNGTDDRRDLQWWDGATEHQKEVQRYLRDITILIQILAPDLETFCLLDPEHGRTERLHIPALRLAGFPSLVEFTIIGRVPTFLPTSDACNPLYPRLRNVHQIIIPRRRGPHHGQVARWKEHAPGLQALQQVQLDDLGLGYGVAATDIPEMVLEDSRLNLSPTMMELLSSACSPPRARTHPPAFVSSGQRR
ncbi:hypothetical protein C8Q77DRAFT_442003 [Trametes polyzona]|nr:hypothetical protein C8Q77DRAFT_442003 [Trametes polyzona]